MRRGRPSSKDVCKPQTRHCHHELTVTIYPLEFQRRPDEKWARAHAPEDLDAKWRLLGLVGRKGRARAWPAAVVEPGARLFVRTVVTLRDRVPSQTFCGR